MPCVPLKCSNMRSRAEAAHGVLADRRGRIAPRASRRGRRRREPVDVAGRERDDAAAAIASAHQRRQIRVHRPGERLVAGRAELPAGHVDDVRRVGQPRDGGFVEQVAADRLDAVRLQRPLLRRGDEKRETPMTRRVTPAASMARLAMRASVGPILPATPRTIRSPSAAAHRVDRRLGGFAEQLFEMVDIANGHRHDMAAIMLSCCLPDGLSIRR